MADQKLVDAYQEMADLTLPECERCPTRSQYRCCSAEYCEMAIKIASEQYKVTLKRTPNPLLPLMGPTGCTAAPHFRPLCTLHTCEINSMGFKKGDPLWTMKYFRLRGKINRLENKRRKETK